MQFYVLSLVNRTHPAATELLDDAVVRDGLTDQGGARDSGWNVRDVTRLSQRGKPENQRLSQALVNRGVWRGRISRAFCALISEKSTPPIKSNVDD